MAGSVHLEGEAAQRMGFDRAVATVSATEAFTIDDLISAAINCCQPGITEVQQRVGRSRTRFIDSRFTADQRFYR